MSNVHFSAGNDASVQKWTLVAYLFVQTRSYYGRNFKLEGLCGAHANFICVKNTGTFVVLGNLRTLISVSPFMNDGDFM